ncbi:hypothetical protein Lbir_2964 [Legionella birminghamensis]|uniref:Uncharacterized protein n=1 Tax=Legionella birminghamensis TaxID=28083 RepID=A0A378I7B6_9GAMM|nr:hypothetical protein [Legionella birminghamensis]KTC68362.1 hypothetical protein Lbir_2964 [Legionella birminghamensis]STX30923.1 Uncharacterised protein [Legionella birminghamensis]
MKIRVIINEKGVFNSKHVLLTAWADSTADCPLDDKKRAIAKIELNFFVYITEHSEGDPWRLKAVSYLKNNKFHNVEEKSDKNSVVLHSEVSFKQFYEDLKNSEYIDGRNFDMNKNNCVSAVLFALDKANISVTEQAASCRYLLACFWGYTNRMTPRILIKVLKEHEAVVSDNRPKPAVPRFFTESRAVEAQPNPPGLMP